jgi:hypothetical protein
MTLGAGTVEWADKYDDGVTVGISTEGITEIVLNFKYGLK